MAMNPMQRRSRNSFFIGFLVALILMALVVAALVMKMKAINEEKEALLQKQITVYVAANDLKSGETVTLEEDFMKSTVQTTLDQSQIISDEDFQYLDEEGNIVIKYNSDGSEKQKEVVLKVDVPAGAIVTKDMIEESDDQTTDTDRIQEFNMISLPSQLKNGDYVDIRMSIPNGQDYIVLAKKKVLGTTSTSIWLKLNELEMKLLSSAIVESYYYTGSKLYAVPYTEPGMQQAAVPTYPVKDAVLRQIRNDPNILDEIRQEYESKYIAEDRVQYFETPLSLIPEEDKNSMVSAGNSDEKEAIKAAREEFVSSLEGTEDIGYTE